MKPEDLDKLWSQILSQLQLSVPKLHYQSYAKIISVKDFKTSSTGTTTLELLCPSVFHVSEIKKRLLSFIQDALTALGYNKVSVVLEVGIKPGKDNELETSPLFVSQTKRQDNFLELLKKYGLSDNLTLQNFAVSSTNEMAYAAAKAVANNPGKAYNPLFLHGGVGVGKTHLMQGVGQAILKKNPSTKIIYCTGEDFTNAIIEAIRQKSTASFRKKYRVVNLLLIDDIQFIAGKASVQEEFFHTFNAIAKEGGQTILTSDKHPKEIDSLEDRLRSRFEGGLTIDIGQPNFELRSAIIMIKADELKINLAPDIAQYIAENEEDTRALLGKLTRVMAVSKSTGKPLTLELAKSVLDKDQDSSTENFTPKKPLTVVKIVSDYFNADPKLVLGSSRNQQLTTPRHIAMHLLKNYFGLSFKEIGRVFGGRDHTSVIHANRKITMLLSKDSHVNEQVEAVKKLLI